MMNFYSTIVRRAHTLYLADGQRHVRPIVALCFPIEIERHGIG